MVELSGKVALVTGGSRGIGKAICEKLLEEKVKVCFGGITLQKGEETVKELALNYGKENVIYEKFDVSNESEFENALKRTKNHFGGQLDILINNAGVINEVEWKKMMQINLVWIFLLRLARQMELYYPKNTYLLQAVIKEELSSILPLLLVYLQCYLYPCIRQQNLELLD